MNIRQIARDFASAFVSECELMLEGAPVLIGTDQGRLRYEPRHTVDHPFCDQENCPCHYDDSLFAEHVEGPMMDGLMTSFEANNLRWNDNI